MRGKLIVIEGIDGSGKATQTKLLAERLAKEGYKVRITDFPQHGKKSAALVDDYLNSKFGKATEVHPCFASMLYAWDRFSMKEEMHKSLSEGNIIVSNRYVSANYGHQGCKLGSKEERIKFFDWVDHLEHDWFGIPKPDLNLFLYVPVDFAKNLVLKKSASTRAYIKDGLQDSHEKDSDHLTSAEQIFLEVVDTRAEWHKISCVKNGKLMSREEIAALVFDFVKQNLK